MPDCLFFYLFISESLLFKKKKKFLLCRRIGIAIMPKSYVLLIPCSPNMTTQLLYWQVSKGWLFRSQEWKVSSGDLNAICTFKRCVLEFRAVSWTIVLFVEQIQRACDILSDDTYKTSFLKKMGKMMFLNS